MSWFGHIHSVILNWSSEYSSEKRMKKVKQDKTNLIFFQFFASHFKPVIKAQGIKGWGVSEAVIAKV